MVDQILAEPVGSTFDLLTNRWRPRRNVDGSILIHERQGIEKAPSAIRSRMMKQVLGVSVLHDAPAFEIQHSIRYFAGKADLVGYGHNGDAAASDIFHQLNDALGEFGVDRCCWFIEQHNLWVHYEHPGDGDPLLFSA